MLEKLPLGKFPYPVAVLNAILSSPYVNGEALGARQHKRDNRSGSTGSGKVIAHGQIALVD